MSLTGSSSYAELGKTFRFTCTVTDNPDTFGTVSFIRTGISSLCSVRVLQCDELTPPPAGYSCGLGPDMKAVSFHFVPTEWE